MRRFRTVLTAAVLCAAGGCGAEGGSAAEPRASVGSSPRASASPACARILGDPISLSQIRRQSSFAKVGDLNTLTIKAGARSAATPEPYCPTPISLTIAQYNSRTPLPGPAGTQVVASYDGSVTVKIPVPILGSPCTSAVVFFGTDLAVEQVDQALPVGPIPILNTEVKIYDPPFAAPQRRSGGPGYDPKLNPIIGTDSVTGPRCQVVVKRA